MTFATSRRLIDTIAAALAQSSEHGAREITRRLAEQNLDESQFIPPTPVALPVLRHLPACIDEARKFDAKLGADIDAVSAELRWLQTSAYTDAILGEGFSLNYGWAELIGPKGFFTGDDFLLGLLMLGPQRHYLDHYHPAAELYWPLTTGSLWRAAPGGFVEKPPGAIIWHEPNQLHATKTGDQPLLAVWAWPSETATPARLATS
ncbi:dimethylsulfonioproprionate lyase family protein [Aestuariivirga litoralis]|uniref:dimethylsulfonioproprionate lyase family protein n=1 Tax=Aestuariivirga litoralis TaxID=2650924 RepID=UPI0018C650E0|nr:dimethylsulfonioproprionate lyase family protein [Aestuariivirga litoralis]MBG1232270.1 transcriptional regulator [Aestuariivirga litoralis]